MKKVKLNAAKLQLHKEKVSNLSNENMANINGGDANTIVIEQPTTGTQVGFLSIGNACSQRNSCARVSCAGNSNCQSTFRPYEN
ncbi:class I lanthipeptide [Taibaiella koreensis]|uniref:class I lanthipeptide n=1 Tax=Taibaiella koreensis TaxID=1268548 RepID=UPI000E59929F|nr:class I lanthipeptide [Taibaiella koreensis]